MEWATQLGLLLFLVSSGLAGGRLLWRGLRTRGLHESLLGVTYFVGGPLGYVPLVLVVTGATPDEWTRPLRAFGHLNLELSALALYVFDRRVFRPASRAAGALAVACCIGLAVGWLGLVLVDGLRGRPMDGSTAYWFDFWVRAGAYAWATVESFVQHRRARRRCALGLADPATANRFLLWGVAMGAITGMFANGLISNAFSPTPVSQLVDGLLAAIASVAIWLTFFAPRRYLERLRAGAGA
jgi:hypothetical protein